WAFFRKPGVSVPWIAFRSGKYLTPVGRVLLDGGFVVSLAGILTLWLSSRGGAAGEAYDRAMAAIKKGDYDRAITCFDDTIRLDSKMAAAYLNRGYCHAQKGDHDKAIADYDKGIQLNGSEAQSYNNRGASYGAKGEWKKAIADFSEAIRLNPK